MLPFLICCLVKSLDFASPTQCGCQSQNTQDTSGGWFGNRCYQANVVDIDVFGLQLLFSKSWQNVDLVAGYSYMDKDEDYQSDTVDASYYALNFARHRATLALRIDITDRLELRLDNEYREQEANPLRASSDSAFINSATLAWRSSGGRGLGVALAADNIGDDDFQQFPGTPAIGQQISLSVRYDW